MLISLNDITYTVSGKQLNVGDRILDFEATTNIRDNKSIDKTNAKSISAIKTWNLSDVGGAKIISVIPSIDTPVCQMQTRRFNREASTWKNVTVITISSDLPFTQARWCGIEGINNILIVSDYLNRDFGKKTSLLIDGIQILSRAVFLLDRTNKITYVEYVQNIIDEPNYDELKKALGALI